MNKFQSLLAGFAAAVGAGGIAAYNGAFSPETPPAAAVSQTVLATGDAPAAAPEPAQAGNSQTASAGQQAVSPVPAPADPAAGPVAPVFDVLRVEPDGSVLIAGKADAGAEIEILSGSQVIGKAKAEVNGDFAVVLDKPLKPGDYQLVLRATRSDGQSASSIETATVSVPDRLNGPVLALVEKPGQPSRIITAPPATEARVAMNAEVPAGPATTQAPAASGAPAAATAENSPAPADPAMPVTAGADTVGIEAVEVEAGRLFVAGKAGGAAIVRLYANDELLGDAKPGAGDRFLLDIQKQLPPGDYIIRAEALASNGVTMLSRSSVPFQNSANMSEQTPAGTAEPSVTVAGNEAAPEPQKKSVIIRRGDTLWQISRRIYGRGVRYSTIYLANENITQNPDRIYRAKSSQFRTRLPKAMPPMRKSSASARRNPTEPFACRLAFIVHRR